MYYVNLQQTKIFTTYFIEIVDESTSKKFLESKKLKKRVEIKVAS